MKQLIRLATSAATMAVIGVLFCALPVFAEPLTPEPDLTLRRIGAGDMTAYGHRATLDIWFPGYGDYELDEGSYLYLDYDHSELLDPKDSTMTAFIDDLPLASVLLTSSNAKRTTWRISLPKDRLKRNINHIALKYYMHLPDDICEDIDESALFSTVYRDSYIHYQYKSPLAFIDLPPSDLGRFPAPFLRSSRPAGEVAFILPDNPTVEDYSAAASVAARFGQVAGGKPFTATLHFASQVDNTLRTDRDIAVVGRPDANAFLDQLSASLPLKHRQQDGTTGFVDDAGSQIAPDSGVLQEMVSPWDKRYSVLVVSGNGDEGLRRAARTVSTRLGMKTLQGAYAIVTKASEELSRGESAGDSGSPVKLSLRQLGVSDSPANGIGEHTITFSFDAPPPDNQQGAFLDLVLAASPLLDQDRSSVTVLLNWVPVRSYLLKTENSDRLTYRLQLPAKSLRPGINSMAVRFNLYARRAEWCGPLAPERAWAVLYSDSALVLPVGSDKMPLNLANLPYPFVKNGTTSGAYLALPDDPALLTDSLQVAVILGRQALGDSTELRAGLAAELSNEDKRNHDIVVQGLPQGTNLLATIGPKLPLSLEVDAQRALQKPELVLLGLKDAANLGIIEIVPSPWNPERSLLVVSGTSEEMARKSYRALRDRIPQGNVATVAEDGRLATVMIAGDVERPVTAGLLQRRTYSVAAIPAVLLIVGLLGIMLTRTARRPK